MTRRQFFQKIKSAVMGAGAAAVIGPAIVAKVASKETIWNLPKGSKYKFGRGGYKEVGKPLTYSDLEKAYNNCMKDVDHKPYQIYRSRDYYRRGLGFEVG